jgi:uncharacterized protein YndB with AHSA1/START domain
MDERGEASIHIDAPPERVYALVSDVTRMGEWSPETFHCEWVDGATGPTVGARFKGRNKQGLLRWSTTPEVIAADPGREFSFVTKMGDREATRWRYRMEPSGGGTELTESWETVSSPAPMKLFGTVFRRDQKLNDGIRQTLERIKAAAEQQPSS